MAKVHYYSLRHFVNAGMLFPLCYSNAKLLDIDKGRLTMTKDYSKVTCKRCLKRITRIEQNIKQY
jgi:hypothetical protein